MPQQATHKLDYSDIGYKGKAVDTLTREELLEAFMDLAQKVYECASQDNVCKNIFLLNKGR